MSRVSLLIPGEDSNSYLLTNTDGRGWWLPHGLAMPEESIKLAAQRIGSEASINHNQLLHKRRKKAMF